MRRRGLRISALFSLVSAIFAGAMLYSVSQEVHRAEGEVASFEVKIKSEKDAIRTLHAEWDYLNHPARLEKLAREYLDMEDPAPAALIAGAGDLPDVEEPTIPAGKPEASEGYRLRPVHATVPVIPSRLPVPAMPPQETNTETDDFQKLLKNLSGGRR